MRGQNDLRIGRCLDRFEQPIRAHPQNSSAHRHPAPDARFADSAVRTKSRVRSPTPAPGPITQALRRLSVSSLGELDHGIDGAHHHGGQRRGIDGKRIARRGQRHEPGAGAQRAARRQPRRAGRGDIAGHHHGMAAGVFVAVDLRHRKGLAARTAERFRKSAAGFRRAPPRRCRYRRRGRGRNGPAPAATDAPACGGRTSRSRSALTATPITAPVVPLMPLGRSTLRTGAPLALIASIMSSGSPFTGRSRPAPNSASMISAGLPIACGIERQHRIFPAPRRGGRIALQAVALAQQDDRDLAAARREFGRRHKTVAAIVAAAGDHQDRPLLDEVHRGFARRPGPRSASGRSRACRRRSRADRHAPSRRWSELPCRIPDTSASS